MNDIGKKGENMNKEKKWNTTVKLQDMYVESIDRFVNDKGSDNPKFNYKSRSDFVIRAIEKEIEHAILTKGLNESGKIWYEKLLSQKIMEAYRGAKELSGSKNLWGKEKNEKEKKKKLEKNNFRG